MRDSLPDSAQQPKKINYKGKQSAAHNIDAGQSWYLVHCKPNGENIALRNLENQGFYTLSPAFYVFFVSNKYLSKQFLQQEKSQYSHFISLRFCLVKGSMQI